MLARVGGALVGYALVSIHEGADDSWPTGDRYAEVETLVVALSWRGHGVGTQLLDMVDEELKRLDITALAIAVVDGNEDARRLYEGRGLQPMVVRLMRFGEPPAGDRR